jgi:hypothetical protein
LVLTSGDVVEGEFRTVADGRVSVSSVLFGLRKFNVSEVAAAILRENPPMPAARNFEVRASDGSLLLVDKLSCENGSLIAETSFAGKLKLGQEQIVEIRAGGPIQAADGIEAFGVSGPTDGFKILNGSGAPTVRGQTLMIRPPAAAPVTSWMVIPPAHAVAVGGILPTTAVRLVVLGMGRRLPNSMPPWIDRWRGAAKLGGNKAAKPSALSPVACGIGGCNIDGTGLIQLASIVHFVLAEDAR